MNASLVAALACILSAGATAASAEAWRAISGNAEGVTGLDYGSVAGPPSARTASFVRVFKTTQAGVAFVVMTNEFDCDARKVTPTFVGRFDIDGLVVSTDAGKSRKTSVIEEGTAADSMWRAACEGARSGSEAFPRLTDFVAHWREKLGGA